MKLRQSTVAAAAIGCFTLFVATGAALAQASAAAPSAVADGGEANSDQLQEVIVTAERRVEDLQHTAAAVSAVSGSELTREVIQSASDLQGIVPGAVFISDTQIAVRGISNNFISNAGVDDDFSVSIFVDGVINPRTEPGLLFDIARVELLRGPQGTLYGRNNTAGALNIINNRPTDQFEGSVTTEGGDYSRFSTAGMLNVPVSDQLELRSAFLTVRHDPYQTDGYGAQDSAAGRLRAQYKPTDKLTVLVGVDFEHDGGSSTTPVFYPPGAPNPTGVPFRPWGGTPICPNGTYVPFSNCAGVGGSLDDTSVGVIGQVDWDIDFANLTYIGGDRDSKTNDTAFGGSGTTHMFNSGRDQWQSHELRLSNANTSVIKWVTGLYYYSESARTHGVQFPPPGAPVLLYQQGFAEPSTSKSKAAFAQATAPIVGPLRLTGGIRYTDDAKRSTQYTYNSVNLSDAIQPGTTIYDLTYNKSNVSFKAGLEADVSKTVLAYVDYSTGYKAGGFYNAFGTNTFKPEEIKAYQGGIKSRFLDNRLQLNIDGFYYRYSDFQIQTLGFGQFDPPPAPPGIGLITLNAEAARFYGGEVEAAALLTRNDLLQINVSLLNATLTNFVIPPNPLGASNLDGYRAPYAPSSSGRVTYRHTLELGDRGKLEGQIEEDLSEGYWVQIQHLAGSYQSSFHRTGADLTYTALNNRWLLSLWGRNLENRATINSYLFALGAAPSAAYVSGQPRTYGLRFTANF